MQIQELILTNFRKFNNFKIKFSNITVIAGKNGSGKTSILEAIYTLSRGYSFNTRQINPLINIGESEFTIFAKLNNNNNNNTHLIGLAKSSAGNTKRRLDHENLNSQAPILDKLPVLAITAQRFNLLKQPASIRRNLLDWGVYYQEPGFIKNTMLMIKTLKKIKATILKLTVRPCAWPNKVEFLRKT